MADDATQNETTPDPQSLMPSWVTSTQNIIKSLLQGAQPAAVGSSTPAPDQLNPWLKLLEKDTAPSASPMMPLSTPQPQAPVMQPHELSAPLPKPKPAGVPSMQPVPVAQIPVQNIMAMGQHQVDPMVEAAKQRVVQTLLRRQSPTTPKTIA